MFRNCQTLLNEEANSSGRSATVVASDVDNMEVSEPLRPQSSTDVASSSQDEDPVPVTVSHRRTNKASTLPSATAPPVSITSTLPLQPVVSIFLIITNTGGKK